MNYNVKIGNSYKLVIKLVDGGFIVTNQWRFEGTWQESRSIFTSLDEVVEYLKNYYLETNT